MNLFNKSKKEIFLLENFVPKRLQDDLEKMFLSSQICWYTDGEVWGKEYLHLDESVLRNKNVIDSVGFHHMLYYNQKDLSQYFLITNSILYFLEMKFNFQISEILRIRARMTTQTPGHNDQNYCGPHVDFLNEDNYYSLVYYVHDTDGDTFIFDETVETVKNNSNVLINPKIINRITPKKGTAVFFKGDIYHAGNCPINEKIRIVLNYDFKVTKK